MVKTYCQTDIRLCDKYLQQWNSEKCNSSRAINYRMFKHDFKLENYLLKLSTKNARILCKFRTGNVKLPIETGRWFNIERDDRICHLCNSDVGDEFHYIFSCTSLSAERNEYIPNYYTNRASAFSFFHLYSTQKNHFCVNCVNIYKLLLRGSVFRVNIYRILRQEPLQKTLCESILFLFFPYCTRCSLMRIKLSCLVLS